MKKFFEKNESKALSPANSLPLNTSTSNALSPPARSSVAAIASITAATPKSQGFFSQILASPDVLDSASFFMKDISPAMLERVFLKTCKETCASEMQTKREETRSCHSAAVQIQVFGARVEPKGCPKNLVAKNISLTSNEDVMPVLRGIVKLSKQVKSTSINILKVPNLNDATTSLVKVPCSAKHFGFRKQAIASWKV
jgi:hypothetical protein